MPRNDSYSDYGKMLKEKWEQNSQSIILGVLVILVGIAVLSRVASDKQKQAERKQQEAQKQQQMQPTAGQTYTVKKGETLWVIAEKAYGTGYAWSQIAKANNLTNPDGVEAGQVLKLPTPDAKTKPKEEVKAVQPTTVVPTKVVQQPSPTVSQKPMTKPAVSGTSYKVVKGDSLWNIALKAYADGYMWTKIWHANRDKIRNPNLIYPDMMLKLPR